MDALVFILIGTLSRLLPHPANITAVGGLALFSGAHLPLKKAAIILLATMFVSDIFLGFHSVMWATYVSILMAVGIGRVMQARRSIARIAVLIFVSSLLFYLITNFAVWFAPNFLYPKTVSGLIECYIMALPFFRNSLLGDFFYTAVFFGGYEMVTALKWQLLFKKPPGNS